MNLNEKAKQATDRVNVTVQNIQSGPKWRLYVLAAALMLVLAYFIWLKFGTKPLKPGLIIQAQTTSTVANMERKAITPKKLMILTPKTEAVKRLHLPETEAANDDEEIIDSVDVPATRYGATSTTFINVSTGTSRTVVKTKESPWFSFLRDNTIGIEYGVGKGGQYYGVDYKRDILQIKGIIIGARGEIRQRSIENDFSVGVRAEYRW